MKKSKEYRLLESLDMMVRTGILKRRKKQYQLTNRFKNNQLSIRKKLNKSLLKDTILMASLINQFDKVDEEVLVESSMILNRKF